jgi:sugar lactone lactonase YvrE
MKLTSSRGETSGTQKQCMLTEHRTVNFHTKNGAPPMIIVKPCFRMVRLARQMAVFFLASAAAVHAAPRIDSISPSQGPIAGGTVVTITGSGFAPGTAVRFNRNAGINVQILSPSQLQVTTPRLGEGPFATALAAVRVSNASGETFTEFLYLPPTIDEIGPGDVTTIAGVGNFVGEGRLATQAIVEAQGTAVDAAGNLYLGEENGGQVRKLDQSGRITTIAGTGVIGFSGDGGPATDAQFNWPMGLAIDRSGNIFIADTTQNNRVRRIDAATGIVNTIAGNGQRGYSGDGGPATQAQLNTPDGCSVAVDAQGNVYVLDAGNQRVRKIDTSGILTTFAGNGATGFSGDAGPAVQASFSFSHSAWPGGSLAVDTPGNVYILDWFNNRIRRVGLDGLVSTVVGGGPLAPDDGVVATQARVFLATIAVDRQDRLLFTHGTRIWRVEPNGLLTRLAGTGTPGLSPDGVLARNASMIPLQISVAPNGDVFVSERPAKRIRRIDAVSGVLATAAGIGPATIGDGARPALAAVFEDIGNIALDRGGSLLAVEPRGSHRIRKIDPTGRIATVAGNGVAPIQGFYYEGVAALNAGMSPVSVDTDASGNIVFTDFCSVRRIGTDGLVRTLVGPLTQIQSCGFSGDGGPATSAQLADEQDTLKLDSQGNIFIADLFNHRVRRWDAATGIITTFAGSGPGGSGDHQGGGFAGDGGPANQALLSGPSDVAFDSRRNICTADVGNQSVRCVDPQGIIRTVAGHGPAYPGDGGPGTGASFAPYRIAFDPTGNMYISDYADGRIRKLDVNGIISTVAGSSGSRGFSGDGGSALTAQFDYGSGLAIDVQGNILVFDGSNRRIRLIKQGAVIAPPNSNTNATGGSPQTAPIRTPFSSPLEVTVNASWGAPAPGVRVDFSAPSSGASCVFSNHMRTISVLTDQNGKAAAPCRATCEPGSYAVTATPLGSGRAGSFSLTNTPAAAGTPATLLCLDDQAGDGRFEVETSFHTAQGGGLSGLAGAVSLPSLGVSRGGLFWFFSANNPEVLLKVLNGCGVNSRYWVFSSAGTNIGLNTTVTDTFSGRQKVYTNSDLTAAAPIQDTDAFPCIMGPVQNASSKADRASMSPWFSAVGAGTDPAPLAVASSRVLTAPPARASETHPATPFDSPACVTDANTLCIDSRFRVTIDYRTVQGGGLSGKGRSIPLASLGVTSGGLFWFFSADNPEMLVKVLDGCSVNFKHWLFYSAGTDLGLTVIVTDTATGETRTYTNPDLTAAAPVQDLNAFGCP